MNFKTPFKVLTTAALIGTLSLSAVAPGAASAAEKTSKTVQAKAELAASHVVLKDAKGNLITLDYNTYLEAKSVGIDLGAEPVSIKVGDKFYNLNDFLEAKSVSNNDLAKAVDLLNANNLAEEITPAEGSIKDGALVTTPSETEEDFKVTEVAAITSKTVEVSFPALAEAKTGVTVELKDNKGNVVEVVAQDLAKGATSAQFDFKAEYKDDLEGVWSIGDAKFSFDELKQIAAISEAADEIKLEAALEAAGIENVNEDLIAEYFEALYGEEFASLADVQKAVDEVNKENEEATTEKAAVNAVVDATSQKALLTALEANFDRVNADWIKYYADKQVTDKNSATSTLLDLTKETAPTGFDKAAIQALVDAVNKDKIDAANTAAKTETTQKEVTALIQKWVKADEGKATAKKDQIAQSTAFELAFKVAESTNKGSLYNNLIKYANEVKGAGFKASDVLNVNQAAYLNKLTASSDTVKNSIIAQIADEKDAQSSLATPSTEIKSIVDENVTELAAAVSTLYTSTTVGTAVAYDATKADTVKAFKESLEDIAAKSANLTGTDKFDISKVDSTKLEAYAAQIVTNEVASVSDLNTAIATVNSGDVLEAAVKVVNDADSTPEEVRAALTRLVSDVTPAVTDAAQYLNLSAASKLDVAQLVIDNRPENGYVASTSSVEVVIANAAVTEVTNLKTLLSSFDSIKLTDATTLKEFDFATVDTKLATVAGTDYKKLTDKVVKIEAAQNFFDAIEVTEKDVSGTTNYTQAKFKTLVELKAAINTAVKAAQ